MNGTNPNLPAAIGPPVSGIPQARRSRWVGGLIVAGLLVVGWFLREQSLRGNVAYQWWGVYAVAVLVLLASALAGRYWPASLVKGEDGRLSVSKTQVGIWTATIAYSYVTLYAARAFSENSLHPIDTIPRNVLIALGLSTLTAIGAKAITVNKIGTNQIQKSDKIGEAGLGDLVAADNSSPDLTKVQLLFWTLVSVAIYVALTNDSLHNYFGMMNCAAEPPAHDTTRHLECLALPNIDTVLMVLMGLAHGTYLGGKLTQANLPRISSVSPMSGYPGTNVVLQGADLGTVTGALYLGGMAYWGSPSSVTWADTTIGFAWPDKDATGNPWVPGTSVAIAVVTGGQQAGGAAAFTVLAPPHL